MFFSPLASAKLRKSYLTDFITSNKISKNGGFTNSVDGEKISYEATFYSLEILSQYNLIPQQINSSGLSSFLQNNLTHLYESEELTLYNIAYILDSLEILENELESNLTKQIESYLNQTEISTGGFASINTSNSANIISTYFAFRNYQLLGRDIPNKTSHLNWILSCYNPNNDGFGGDPSLPSTLVNTYYAILSIELVNNTIDLPDRSGTLSYIESFYSSLGGFLPDLSASKPLISSTFYAIRSIIMLDSDNYDKNSIIDWVLDKQNLIDGGFSESSTNQEKSSSVINSYFAFNILLTLNALSYLNEDVGIVQFNWVILLYIVIGISIVIGLGFFIWKKKKL